MWRRRMLALAIGGAPLAGCGDDGESVAASTTNEDSSTTSTTADADTTTTSTTGGETTSTVAQPAGDELVDGTHFGYITELSVNDTTVTGQFDLAEIYFGEEAAGEAAEDGAEFLGDFYIRNVNPRLRPIEVDPDAPVTDIDYDACCDPVSTNVADFAADLDPPTPVMLSVAGGLVTIVEELYFP